MQLRSLRLTLDDPLVKENNVNVGDDANNLSKRAQMEDNTSKSHIDLTKEAPRDDPNPPFLSHFKTAFGAPICLKDSGLNVGHIIAGI